MIIDWSSFNGRGIRAEGLAFVSVFTGFGVVPSVIPPSRLRNQKFTIDVGKMLR